MRSGSLRTWTMREWIVGIPDKNVPKGKVVLLNDDGAVLDVAEIGLWDGASGNDVAAVVMHPNDIREFEAKEFARAMVESRRSRKH